MQMVQECHLHFLFIMSDEEEYYDPNLSLENMTQ